MFKKRLKGLLAMVLAGSIATTALPLSASATISGDIRVAEVGGLLIDPNNMATGLDAYSGKLYAENLWAIYGEESESESGPLIKTATGNELTGELTDLNSSDTTYSNVKIKYKHKVLVTTDDPATTDLIVPNESVDSFPDSVYHVNFGTYGFVPINNKLQEATWTVWYGEFSSGKINAGTATQSGEPTLIPEGRTSIEVPMDRVKGLYSSSDRFDYGVTIIQLNSYKTFDIPVLNGLGEAEMIDGENPYTLSVTGGCDDYLGNGRNQYYVGYTNQNGEVVLSNYLVNNQASAWEIIEEFAADDQNFDVDTLFFLRDVMVQVYKDSTFKGNFTSKDLYPSLATNDTENLPDEYKYIVEADDNSIWLPNISQKFVLGEDLLEVIGTYLDNNPDTNNIILTETTEIIVTGTEPNQGGIIESYEISPLYVEDPTVPATISDHAAVLAKSVAPEAGNIYDTSNWQLWGCGFTSGGVGENDSFVFLQKSALESTNGVNSIGIDQLNTLTTNCYPLIYFPQVKDTPRNPGGSSGGSSSRPEPSYDPNKPTIDGEEKDWDDVARDIGKFSEGETKTITLGRDKTIPADVIKAIKDSKAIITFKINSAFSWTVDGSTLTDGDIHDYDFSIELITAAGVEILRGDVGVGFKIGDISDGATLNINFKIEHAQKFANLYKMVDGELVFVDNVKIDENGAAIGLEVTEAGDYVVMLGKMSDRPGDMDNDGIMNAKDSLAILKDFLGMESGANPLVSDMNGDSFINAKDALIIVKKSVGIE